MSRKWLVVLVLTVAPTARVAAQTTQPVDPAAEMAALIEAVGESENPREVMSAYARGSALDRGDAELQNAYMRRMLKFGMPQIAYYPARVLVTLEKDHHLAWGVVGYAKGKRGNLAEAMTASIRAAEGLGDDPSVLHNLGQLVCWYDHALDPPDIPDSARRRLSRIKADLEQREPYIEAYRQIADAFERRARRAGEIAEQVGQARVELREVRDRATELNERIRELRDDIDYHEELIDSYRRQLVHLYRYSYDRDYGPGGYRPHHPHLRRIELLDRIRQEERTVESLESERRALRREGRGVMKVLRKRRAALEDIRRQERQARDLVHRQFRWDPPAVDGVVVDEVDPLRIVHPKKPSNDPEVLAGNQLQLVEAYLVNDMPDKAVEVLQNLLKKYPATEAAKKAAEMLGRLSASK